MGKLSKTGIEYGDYGWSFYPGCLHKQQNKCPVTHCWAEGMSKRQRQDFHKPHLIPERLLAPLSVTKPSRILVNFMGDLFGDWVDPNMECGKEIPRDCWREAFPKPTDFIALIALSEFGHLREIPFYVIEECPQHTFIFLTKNPAGLAAWSPFPENCWVGVSATDYKMANSARYYLRDVKAPVKFISFEPLLGQMQDRLGCAFNLLGEGISWVIIGQQTPVKTSTQPRIEWITEIEQAARRDNIPVFEKNNLAPLLNRPLRQEFPSGVSHV